MALAACAAFTVVVNLSTLAPQVRPVTSIGRPLAAVSWKRDDWISDRAFLQKKDAIGDNVQALVLDVVSAETGKTLRTVRLDKMLHPLKFRRPSISTDGRYMIWADYNPIRGSLYSFTDRSHKKWPSSDYLYVVWWHHQPKWVEILTSEGGWISSLAVHDAGHPSSVARYSVPKSHLINKGNHDGFVSSWLPLSEAIITSSGKLLAQSTWAHTDMPMDKCTIWMVDLTNPTLPAVERSIPSPRADFVANVKISPNGTRIAWVIAQGTTKSSFGQPPEWNPARSNQGDQLYYVLISRIDGTQPTALGYHILPHNSSGGSRIWELQWMPSGKSLIVLPEGGTKALRLRVPP